ncbi:MAG: T9SS type A sorting domain-containing protein, partial [Ignavibacteriales bacterium]|nr:T9SS type A sorting domain-containing protein [Ignavibacteriales bacterium]
LTIADTAALDLTGAFTIECWAYIEEFGLEGDPYYFPAFVNKPTEAAWYSTNYRIGVLSNDRGVWGYYTSSSGIVSAGNSYIAQKGDWYRYTLVRDTTTKKLKYIIHGRDGEVFFYNEVNFASPTETIGTSGLPLFIGWSGPYNHLAGTYDSTDMYLDGKIDEIRISNVARDYSIPPQISGVTILDNIHADSTETAEVFAVISHPDETTTITDKKLLYSTNKGASWSELTMTTVGGDTVSAVIPPQPEATRVDYYVLAVDYKNDSTKAPSLERDYYTYGFYRTPRMVLETTFENSLDDQSYYQNSTIVSNTGTGAFSTDAKEGTYSYQFLDVGNPEYVYFDSPFLTMRNFTIELWFKIENDYKLTYTRILTRTADPRNFLTESYRIRFEPNGDLVARYDTDGPRDAVSLTIPDSLIDVDSWYKIIYQKSDSLVQFHLKDAVGDSLYLAADSTDIADNPPIVATAPLRLGGAGNVWDRVERNFIGKIDDLEIRNDEFYNQLMSLDDFAVEAFGANVSSNSVELTWRAPSEASLEGFQVQRREQGGDYVAVDFVERVMESNGAKARYRFVDGSLTPNAYEYRLKCVGYDGSFVYSDAILATVETPSEFALKQNYPNPFNPTTTVDFTLPDRATARIDVYNQLGERVAVLLDETLDAGYHSTTWNAANFPSGVYFYQLSADGRTSVQKMVLLK